MRTIVVILVLFVVIAAGGAWYWRSNSGPDVEFKMAKVTRGDLLSTISATGTIEPEEVVDVGSQVNGLILSFGDDANGHSIDYRSPVKANMVLAHIDDATYKADFDTASALVAQAKANKLKAQADVDQAKAKLAQAESTWKRAEKIGPSDALSQNDYDMYKSDYATAAANVEVAKAEFAQADPSIAQAQAGLDKAKRNLEFCTIRSPVDGVIIDRRVNIGQAVASNLSVASMFLIAKDLTKMQIWVAVNEADIGQIHPGQDVTFTCDAFPGQTFTGKVGKIRLNAQMTQNVVTYTVEVNTDNSSGKLLPYQTANIQFIVKTDSGVLMVPNAALRWYPSSASEVAQDVRDTWKPIDEQRQGPSADGEPHKPVVGKAKRSAKRKGTIWVAEGDFVRPKEVTVGETDGINTEIAGDDLKEGTDIVDGEIEHSSDSNSGMHNPFLPQMGRRRGGR